MQPIAHDKEDLTLLINSPEIKHKSWIVWVGPNNDEIPQKWKRQAKQQVRVMQCEGSPSFSGFEDGGWCHEPRNVGALQQREKVRSQILPQSLQKGTRLLILAPKTTELWDSTFVLSRATPRATKHSTVEVTQLYCPGYFLYCLVYHKLIYFTVHSLPFLIP